MSASINDVNGYRRDLIIDFLYCSYDKKLMISEVATLSGDGQLPLKTVHV